MKSRTQIYAQEVMKVKEAKKRRNADSFNMVLCHFPDLSDTCI